MIIGSIVASGIYIAIDQVAYPYPEVGDEVELQPVIMDRSLVVWRGEVIGTVFYRFLRKAAKITKVHKSKYLPPTAIEIELI